MKKFQDEKVCRKCGDRKGPFIKIGRSKWKQAYYCRKCNTAKTKLYISTPEGKIKSLEANKRAYYRNYEKSMARAKISYAIASGKLVRPRICSGCKKRLSTEAHHFDYAKPLDVIWLCKQCHCNVGKN